MYHHHNPCVFVCSARLFTEVVDLILIDCPAVGHASTCALKRHYVYLAITASPTKFMHAMRVVHGLHVERDHAQCCVFVEYGIRLYLLWCIATCSEIICDHNGIQIKYIIDIAAP